MVVIDMANHIAIEPRGVFITTQNDLMKNFFHLFLKPLPDRQIKALFAAAVQSGWKQVSTCLFEDVLTACPLEFERSRQAKGKLDQMMIQKGNTNFQGVPHAGQVNLGQHIEWELEQQIRKKHAVNPIVLPTQRASLIKVSHGFLNKI